MTIDYAPIPGASYTCDACGVSREWGVCQERNPSARIVICRTCLSKPSLDKRNNSDNYILPSDAVSQPSASALETISDF